MILVISSPSSSTTGFLTLIFLIAEAMFLACPTFSPGQLVAGAAKRGRWCPEEGRVREVWVAKHRVAKPQALRLGSSLAVVAAAERREVVVVVGRMVEVVGGSFV
jgi:hypothetical protein